MVRTYFLIVFLTTDKFDTQMVNIKHEDFYNNLTKTNITRDEYDIFKLKCEQMSINTLGQWHDLYLAKDVLLLDDFFERFRQTCIEYYKLDPYRFISTPDLSWNASRYQAYREAPKFTIEIMADSDMYLMIEKDIRGGLSQIGDLRYAKADENDKVKEDGENCEKNEEAREEDGEKMMRMRKMGRKRMRIGRKRRMRTRKMEDGQTTCDSESTTTNDTETDTTVNLSATSTRKNGITTIIIAVVTTVVTTSTTTTKTTTYHYYHNHYQQSKEKT